VTKGGRKRLGWVAEEYFCDDAGSVFKLRDWRDRGVNKEDSDRWEKGDGNVRGIMCLRGWKG
jgi:hypothetical protein